MNTGFSSGVNQSLAVAEQHLRKGNIEYATQIIESVLDKNPNNVDALHLMSMVKYMTGDISGAIECCQDVLEHAPDSIPVLNNLGNFHKIQNNLPKAKEAYKKVLFLDSSCFPAQYNLGNVEALLGNSKQALKAFQKAVKLNSQYPDCYYNMGIELGKLEEFEEAIESFKKAVALEPEHADAHCQLGNTYYKMGAMEKASNELSKAVACKNASSSIFNNYGVVLTRLGNYKLAIEMLNKALKDSPNEIDFRNNLGVAQSFDGDLDSAMLSFKTVIKNDPNHVEAHRNLAVTLQHKGDKKAAEEGFRKALEIDPDYYDALVDLSVVLYEQQREDESLSLIEKAEKINPEMTGPKFAKTILQLRHFAENEEELKKQFSNYQKNLEKLRDTIDGDSIADWHEAAIAVDFAPTFTLILHDRDIRDVQKQYVSLVRKVLAKAYPEWSDAPVAEKPEAGEKIKLAVVSAFFYDHSVHKMITDGWVRGLDREKFHITAYSTGNKKDFLYETIKKNYDEFVEIADFESIVTRIHKDKPHVLLYPSIGMVTISFKLACMRLAPVQCAGWGHPLTQGLDETIDSWFVSDWLEPEDAQKHYTEKIVRLPRLGSYYDPMIPDAIWDELESFGLKKDAVKYLCVQTLHKYLPQHDRIFVEIAKKVPNAQFLFGRRDSYLAEKLMERFERVFSDNGLDAKEHICFLPHLNAAQYQGLCQSAQIYLDTPLNSGLLSSIEAIETGIVPVTMPGQFMRSRQTAELLKRLEVTDSIVQNLDEYIEKASELAKDKGKREKMREKIKQNKDRLYRHSEVQEALNEHILKLAADKLN